jgi:hypothetical protein
MTICVPVRCTRCQRIAVIKLDQPVESQNCPFCHRLFEKIVAQEIVHFHGPHLNDAAKKRSEKGSGK